MSPKIRVTGPTLEAALNAIRPSLTPEERKDATRSASQIITAIISAYDSNVKQGEIGPQGKGAKGKVGKGTAKSQTGLIYGRIQSGKTRAMVTSAALAFDNKIRVVVVVTSNNNRLVDQTHQDFRKGLPGNIGVYSKAHFSTEIEQAKQILESGEGGIVLICSKGAARLPQATAFLTKTGANKHPSVIFDDEGDQATLDTNTWERSKQTKNVIIPPSKIHRLIHDPAISSLRRSLPRHIFVSVTGTPSGLVLQNIENRSRPAFIELLEAGKHYVGGGTFFATENPEHNHLITLIDSGERIQLLGKQKHLPEGLKGAIRFFLLAAAAAGLQTGWPADDQGYKLLCHPSVKNIDQEKVAELIRDYVVYLSHGLNTGKHVVMKDIQKSYDLLKKHNSSVPKLVDLVACIRANMASREILILNKNTTGDELSYSRCFNLLVGGNTLGRGLAIKNLLVTYYVREAVT